MVAYMHYTCYYVSNPSIVDNERAGMNGEESDFEMATSALSHSQPTVALLPVASSIHTMEGSIGVCVCGSQGQFECSGCGKQVGQLDNLTSNNFFTNQVYCSSVCQRGDWPRHNKACKEERKKAATDTTVEFDATIKTLTSLADPSATSTTTSPPTTTQQQGEYASTSPSITYSLA